MKKLIANDYNVLDVLKENPNGGYFGKHKDENREYPNCCVNDDGGAILSLDP